MPDLPPLPAFIGSPMPRIRDVATRRVFLDSYLEKFEREAMDLATKLHSGAITVDAWELAMRRELKSLHTSALILAYGGEAGAIPFSEWGRLGGHIRVQYRYLHNYARAIQENALGTLMGASKPFSEKYLQARSKLYGGNARASFYRGMAMGLLPQVPGDGQTQCLTNCKCTLRFEEGEQPGLLLVFWELNPAEHCDDCISLSQQWNPYDLWLPVGLSAQDWVTWLPQMEVDSIRTRAGAIEID